MNPFRTKDVNHFETKNLPTPEEFLEETEASFFKTKSSRPKKKRFKSENRERVQKEQEKTEKYYYLDDEGEIRHQILPKKMSKQKEMADSVPSEDVHPTSLSRKDCAEDEGDCKEAQAISLELPTPEEFLEETEARPLPRQFPFSQAIFEVLSLELPEGVQESDKGLPLPTIGKWIKWDRRIKWDSGTGSWSKGQVTGVNMNKKQVSVNHINGVDLTLLTGQDKWSYCEVPSAEEKEKAEWEMLNYKIGGRFCNTCKCVTKKLLLCKGCFKVYYCDQTCQMDDRNSHKADCKREKIVLKPNPRYPLSEVSNDVKKRLKKRLQVRRQNEIHQILHDAVYGNFTLKHTDEESDYTVIRRNPKSGDLEWGDECELKVNNTEMAFTWYGLENMDHTIPEGHPTSCTLFEDLEKYLNDEEIMKGGLHYLANFHPRVGIFWSMLINFNTFGTVAPLYGPCICNPKNAKAQMSPERRELRKKWNRIFARIKADSNDVQCMFSDSEEGCPNYNDCPYKHNVAVKKEKKKVMSHYRPDSQK